MAKLITLGLIIIAVIAVAVADVFTKKLATQVGSFKEALHSPLLLLVFLLYMLQILLFLYVFIMKAELGIVGIVQTALYAAIVIGSGLLFFHEKISPLQGIGMGLAILGVILTNF